MGRGLLTISAAFAGGAIGAVVNGAAVWASVRYNVLHALGITLAPHFSLPWLYLRVAWGGLWGLLMAIPLGPRSVVSRGLLWSLVPTLFQLFWVFPRKTPYGLLGIGAGVLTPAAILVFNGIWGLTAAVWLRVARS